MSNGIEDGQAVERQLACALSEEELIARGGQMAEAELKIETLKGERKMLNAQINQYVEQRAQLGHTIDSGIEERTVVCKWIADYTSNEWRLVRQDNGDQVEARTMSSDDLQVKMGFDAAEADTEPPPAKGKRKRAAKSKPAKKASKSSKKKSTRRA
jgi:hypothetical protein